MTTDSRLRKSILNARVGLLFYFLTLILSFFSRKIFLDCLGDEFIGLIGTLQNILGFLNLAEFGIGASVSFFLFKPLQAANKEKIIEIMSLFGYLYRKIGSIIAIGGLVIGLALPLIFRSTTVDMGIVYFAFVSYLASSLIGYFINYRQLLLSADQKNYVISAYFQTAGILKTAIQIILAYNYSNLYIWVSIEFLFGIISSLILNWKINREYPWLKSRVGDGKVILKRYPDILTNTKQIFIHKMKDFLLTQSDGILVFAFVSLKMVAFYGNYTLIINKLLVMVTATLDGVSAGVGNLVAEGNKSNTMKVFWELMAIRYFVGGTTVFSLYHLLEPFINWWLGSEYILGHDILILLMINLFIMQTRGVVDIFNHAHGLYADTWSAWIEGTVNIGVTIAAATQWGITGILLGKIASICLIIVVWKPYYLFSQGLKISIREYWYGIVRYYIAFIIPFAVLTLIARFIPINPMEGISQFLIYAVCLVIPFVLLYFMLIFFITQGMRDVIRRFHLINRFMGPKKTT